MRLYLKHGSAKTVITGVTLRDGHQPAIGKTLPYRPETGELIPLEPASWYKTLLIDAIIIDCDSQEVKWRRRHASQEVSDRGSVSERFETYVLRDDEDDIDGCIITDGEHGFPALDGFEQSMFGRGVYDYEPVSDGVFPEVVDLLETHQNKKTGSQEFNLTVLRLLHCYILPQIVLLREDTPLLQRSLEFLDRQMELAETAIDKKSESVELLQTTLKRLRASFMDEFQREEYVRLYNSDFLRKISYKLQSDVEDLSAEFERLQNEVNQIKGLGNDTVAVTYLIEKRKVRDLAWNRVERAAIMRENVRNAVVKPSKPKRFPRIWGFKPTMLETQNRYMEVHKLCEEKKAEMLDLYNRKVKVISVREAIKSALADLETDGETVGLHLKVDGSERATDVMGVGSKPEEWMTLEERVGNAISVQGSALFIMHTELCNSIRDQVRTVLDEVGILNVDRENNVVFREMQSTFKTALDLAGVYAQRRRTRSSSSRLIQSLCLYGEETVCPLKVNCDKIKNDIHNGITKVVKCLKEEHILSSNEGKLWMCYESHIYPKVMPDLNRLYENTFKPLTTMLGKKLPTLTPADLDVSEDWLLELTEMQEGELSPTCSSLGFCDWPQLTEETLVKRPISDCSDTELPGEGTLELSNRISLELSGHSLHELYQRANMDGQKIQEEIESNEMLLSGISSGSITDVSQDGFSSLQTNGYDGMGKVGGERFEKVGNSSAEPIVSNNFHSFRRETDVPILTSSPRYNNDDETHLLPRCSFKTAFRPAMRFIRSISDSVTVLAKLIQLTKSFRFISHKVSELRSSHGNHGNTQKVYQACCDDMVTVCLLLLTYLSAEDIRRFYTNLCLMDDLMAPCLRHGVHDCTIVSFKSAFQYAILRQLDKLNQSGNGRRHVEEETDV